MTAELIFTKNGYEIWTDVGFVSLIMRKSEEDDGAYKIRAIDVYMKHVESLRQSKIDNSKKTIRTDII